MATTTFDNLITFSRGSNATVTGPNGLIQWAPSNLLTNSQDFEAAAWAKVNTTTTPNAVIAPDGTTTADTISATANGQAYVRQNATVSATASHTTSIYLRAGTVSWCLLEIWNSGVTKWSGRYINLANGTLGGSTSGGGGLGGVFSVTDAGNGWYRVIATAASDNTVLTPALYVADGDGDINVLAGNGISVWGAQLELGSTATTYNNTSVRNLLGFSEAFDNAAWVKTRCSMVTGAQANPVNGLFNAQKLMEDTAATGARSIVQSGGVIGGTETLSVYLKAAGRQWAALQLGSGGLAYYNLGDGSLGTVTGGTGSIVPIGSGWFRCSLTATRTGTTNNFVYLASANTVTSYTGDGNSGVYIYGAMLSNSASLDPYVPTPGAAPSSTAYYGPRFDYDPVTLLPRGFLVEETRTNFLRYSNEFDNVVWTNASPSIPTVTTNTATAPDGTITADTLTAATGGTSSQTRQIASSTGATGNFTGSVFLKAGTSTRSRIIVVDSTSSFNVIGDFAIAWSGGVASVQSVTLGTASVTAVGNGWYRCALAASAPSANASVALAIFPDILVGTNSVVAWGAQLEAGAFATSYIPTIASTVTRSADVATITGSLFSQWYGQAEGTFVVEASSFGIGSNLPTFLNTSDGSANNYMRINGASSYIGRAFIQSGGATSANITVGAGLAAGAIVKVASVYALNSFQLAVNATLGTEDTSGAVPVAINQIAVGNWLNQIGTVLNGHIRSIRYVPVRAADFQLQQVTT